MPTFIAGKNRNSDALVTNPFPVELSDGTNVISDNNPLPTKDIDGSHREAQNTVFGDRIVGRRVPTVASQFHYPLQSDRATTNFVNGGTLFYEDSMLKIKTDIAQTGSISEVQGTFFLRYIPGFEAQCFFTSVFSTPGASDSYQRIGLFDGDNGFYVGYEGSDFVIGRVRDGERFTEVVDVASVFPSEFNAFDPKLGNVYKISFGYLGFATIHFEIMNTLGSWVTLGEINFPNTSILTHIATTYLPIRAEISNGSGLDELILSSGSVYTGIVDGSGEDPGARNFSFTSLPTALAAGTTEVVTFRNKNLYAGKENRIRALLTLISAATDGTKNVSWKILKNPTITTPGTFTDVDTADSIMDYSVNEVHNLATGTGLIDWQMAKVDSFFEQVEQQLVDLRPNDYAVILATTTAPSSVSISFRWKELF